MNLPPDVQPPWTFEEADCFAQGPPASDEERGLLALYSKAKRQQWDAERDLDWTHELRPDNPLQMPDGTLLVFGTPLWDRLDETGRADLRQHVQAWTLSQILHGEQAGLLCAARLVREEPSAAARLCAASQVADEARHLEVFGRLLGEKFELRYPLSTALRHLVDDVLASRAPDIVNLGVRVLIDSIALATFQSLLAYAQDPFVKDLTAKVMRDESRHFAIGRATLPGLYRSLTPGELAQRQEFVSEAAVLLHEHLCADDIWEPLGLPGRECRRLVRESPVAQSLRRSLFRRLVPSVREMNLLGGCVQRTFERLGVLDYAVLPLREAH